MLIVRIALFHDAVAEIGAGGSGAPAGSPQGGIVNKEAFLDVSNVMFLFKGQPTRIGFKLDGDKKVRVAKKTGEAVD